MAECKILGNHIRVTQFNKFKLNFFFIRKGEIFRDHETPKSRIVSSDFERGKSQKDLMSAPAFPILKRCGGL